jgi:hypothetical protein
MTLQFSLHEKWSKSRNKGKTFTGSKKARAAIAGDIGMGRSQRLSVFSSELGHSMASTVTGLKMLKNIESTKKPHNICLGGHTRGLGTNSHSFSLFLPAPITSDYTQSGK